MAYPFRQGLDYGPRKGTLGLVFHMSEGGDELVSYLARRLGETDAAWRDRIRGVSANAAILSNGVTWQMVPWDHASGSLNPADRNPATSGYFNGTVVRAVLGDHFVDPNTWSISCEIAGRRADGPTPAQVEAAITWGLDMRTRFPTIRGAYGHHDQTDTKGCPGATLAMRAIFDGVGGHGLFQEDQMAITTTISVLPFGGLITVPPGKALTSFRVDPTSGAVVAGPKLAAATTARSYRYDANVDTTATRGEPFVRVATGPLAGWIVAATGLSPTPDVPPLVEESAIKATERDRVKAAAVASIEAIQ